MSYVDPCIETQDKEIHGKAREIGWDSTNADFNTVFLEASDWGELKKKISQNREDADILVFRAGNEELDRKAVSDPRLDVLLSPGKGRSETGVDKVIAEKAAENGVAIGLSFRRMIKASKKKKKVSVMSDWRQIFRICEKFDTKYLITTGAEEKFDLRSPKDLKSLVRSLNGDAEKSLDTSDQMLQENMKKSGEDFVRPGVEKK
ncbi:RNase P subunit p30 family protein [Candidatus Nanosalina sp. VS9-1]|uniref:RNase P subunit p30 family protein n=1 Tax=Candidatus Nanosalina sp. VS9-1 TaxID=3388566 RepID=UPI0039E07989